VRALVVLILLIAGGAWAQDDVDREVAQRHFERGRAAYDQHDYAGALGEFQTAKKVLAVPALEYNIARCLDRLERWDEAAAAYRRYLTALPDSPDVAEVRARIEVLESRHATPSPAPAASPAPAVIPVAAPVAAPPASSSLTSSEVGAPARPRRHTVAIAASITAVVVVGVALGVGLGVGLAPPGHSSSTFGVVKATP
jgi:tetratricopeptide (TPR) repeat protein